MKKKNGTTGSRPHKPQPIYRQSTHARILDNGAEAMANISIEDRVPNTVYAFPLTDEALEYTNDFALRAMLEKQYENYENAIATGLTSGEVADESLLTPDPYQEIYLRLLNLQEVVNVAIGGIRVIYDTSPSEIITVAEARTRGYSDTFVSDAADSDFFIVPHVVPSDALSDSTYGVDIIDEADFHGSLKVFGGKVVRDVPKPDLSFTYLGNPAGDAVSDAVIDPTNGSYFHTTLALPIISGGGSSVDPSYPYSNVPSNCCNGGAQPPATPPITPTPPVSLPPIPAPNGTTSSDTVCSEIFTQSGQGFDFWSDLASFSARIYGNRPANSTEYPLSLSTLIHAWITTFVTDFDFGCDTLLSIKFLLHMTHTDPRIFGVITNPFGSNNVTPRIDSFKPVSGGGINHEPIYYFQPDRSVTEFLGPVDIIVNRYTKSIYEASHKVTVRPADREDGSVGYEYWKFYVDESDVIDAASVDPLSLQVCGIDYKKHQYLFHWKFDGSDEIRIIGTATYIYDQYGNGRIPVPTGFFETAGFEIDTDAVHGFNIQPDSICNWKGTGANFYVFGSIKTKHSHWDTGTTIHCQVLGALGDVIGTATETFFIPFDGTIVQFAFNNVGAYPGFGGYPNNNLYNVHIYSDTFPEDSYILLDLTAYLI